MATVVEVQWAVVGSIVVEPAAAVVREVGSIEVVVVVVPA